MKAPQNRRFYRKTECLPLWPTYIGEKGRILGKTYETYGITARCYWEHPCWTHWEHIGNLMGTHWKLERNMLGTREKWKKSFPPTPSLTNFCFREMVSLGGATIFLLQWSGILVIANSLVSLSKNKQFNKKIAHPQRKKKMNFLSVCSLPLFVEQNFHS